MSRPGSEIIDCEEALRRLAEHLDGELGDVPASEVERHLETCRSCYSRSEFERGLRVRLRDLRHETVDPAFGRRIDEIVQGFTSP